MIVGTGAKFVASSIASLIIVVLAYLTNRLLGSK